MRNFFRAIPIILVWVVFMVSAISLIYLTPSYQDPPPQPITFQNHQYVKFRVGLSVNIVHDPNCHCLSHERH